MDKVMIAAPTGRAAASLARLAAEAGTPDLPRVYRCRTPRPERDEPPLLTRFDVAQRERTHSVSPRDQRRQQKHGGRRRG